MQIVIDIPKELYIHLYNGGNIGACLLVENAIANGTPLPKGHGRLIDAKLLSYQFPMWIDNFSSYEVNKTITKAETIIKADEGE